MDSKLNQLLDLYLNSKFKPGTGSENWWDIKTELLVMDDFIVALTMNESLKAVDGDSLRHFHKRLSELAGMIENYRTIDQNEIGEKVIVQQRAKYGLEILDHIAKELGLSLN